MAMAGFIGLGTTGWDMAARLLAAGQVVRCHGALHEPAVDFARRGGAPSATVRDAAGADLALERAAGLDLRMLREVFMDGAARFWMPPNVRRKIDVSDASAGLRIDRGWRTLRVAGDLDFGRGVAVSGLALVIGAASGHARPARARTGTNRCSAATSG